MLLDILIVYVTHAILDITFRHLIIASLAILFLLIVCIVMMLRLAQLVQMGLLDLYVIIVHQATQESIAWSVK